MSLPVQDVIQYARKRLRDPDPEDTNFSNAELVEYVNEARIEIASRIPSWRATATIIGDGSTRYPLPDDCLRIEEVTSLGISVAPLTIRDSVPFSPLEPVRATLTSNAYGWYVKGDDIYFFPTLGSGDRRQIHYQGVTPRVENENSVLECPLDHLSAYGCYVAASCFAAGQNQYWHQFWQAKFEDACDRARAIERERQHPAARGMRKPRLF